MKTIERTQIEMFQNADQGNASSADPRQVAAIPGESLQTLAQWEVMLACGGENSGCW
jgi:hypothetical protein